MTALEGLFLDHNLLQGPVLASFLEFGPQFASLDLSVNKLEHNVPSYIGQLTGLAYLNLSYNNFNGHIPDSLRNLSNMNQLDLSDKHFQGTIPARAISAMASSLTYLNLAHNFFSGSWPREFNELVNLQTLSVAVNNPSGSIPLGMGKCSALQSFDISINNFTGEIPQDLGTISSLVFFNASLNDFEGPIPQLGFCNSTDITKDSFLGNPGLCGPPLIICVTSPMNVSLNATGHRSCGGFKCKQVWIPVLTVMTVVSLGIALILTRIKLQLIFSRGWISDNYDRQVITSFSTSIKFTERIVVRTISDPSGENIIGRGTKSIVYKGVQPGGIEFALKRILPSVDSHDQETQVAFKAYGHGVDVEIKNEIIKEAQTLAQSRYRNIVKCLNFYCRVDLKALILEYMCQGSLHKHLYEVPKCELTWQTRLKVATGVAQGLVYLHHEFPQPIIHRDMKPANILPDEDFEPKIGDFGVSKFANPMRDGEATTSTFCGTIGYIPPGKIKTYAGKILYTVSGTV